MKIAYVGNFTQPHCTEVHLAATLEKLGHEVIRLQEDGMPSETLGGMIALADWDLFLFTRTWDKLVTLGHLAQLRERKIPSASYHLDLYVGLSRKWLHEGKSLDEVLQSDPFWRTDFVFTPDGDPKSQAVFEANGVNHVYLKPAVYEPECRLANKSSKDYDVLFVGGGDRPGNPNIYGHPEWDYRNQLIGWLYDTYGERFIKFGHPQETIRNAALNQLYIDSKVVVGDSVCVPWEDGTPHSYYWSDRAYETIGRGGFLIHPYIKGMEEEFIDGKTIVFYEYNNWEQLKEKIDYYLEHDQEREAIRHAGFEFVKKHATYTIRLQQMLDIVFNKKADAPKAAVAPVKISLGAGTEIEPLEEDDKSQWVNVDIVKLDGIDVVHNLMHFPYPFGDSSADYIKAKDLIEHLASHLPDGRNTMLAFVEECHRILRPGGTLWVQTPGWDADFLWIDPTHVRGFDRRSFDFFDPDTDFGRSTGFYSPAKFEVSCEVLDNKNLIFEMIKR